MFRELLLPKLPSFIASFFPGDKPSWPFSTDINRKPSEVKDDVGLHVLFFEAKQTIPALKRAAARTGVRTINALLHAAALVALSSAIQTEGGEAVLKSGTPTSVREPEHESHGLWTGVYIGFVGSETGSFRRGQADSRLYSTRNCKA